MGIELNIANDNAPIRAADGYVPVYGGDATGRQMLVRERAQRNMYAKTPRAYPVSQYRTQVQSAVRPGFLQKPSATLLALALWGISLALCYAAVQQFITPLPRIMAAIGAGWASLFLAYTAK